MAIRKPSLSVSEARNRAETRSAAMQPPQSPNAEIVKGLPKQPEGYSCAPVKKTELTTKASGSQTDSTGHLMREEAPTERPVAKTKIPAASTLQSQNRRMEKEQVYLSALLPAPGVSKIYEMLCRQYPPQKALQMVLRRAFQDYEAMLQSGSFRNAHEGYAVDEKVRADEFIQTSRMVPRKIVSIARAHFDPLGLESTRSFGRKLATAALAHFFALEATEDRGTHSNKPS